MAIIPEKRRKEYVVETIQSIIFGDPQEIFEMIGANSDGCIGTSYVERINIKIRTSLARFITKGMNFSKTMKMHQKTFAFFQEWRKKITDNIWNLKELLTFRVSVQRLEYMTIFI